MKKKTETGRIYNSKKQTKFLRRERNMESLTKCIGTAPPPCKFESACMNMLVTLRTILCSYNFYTPHAYLNIPYSSCTNASSQLDIIRYYYAFNLISQFLILQIRNKLNCRAQININYKYEHNTMTYFGFRDNHEYIVGCN